MLYNNFDKVKSVLQSVWGWLKQVLKEAWDFASTFMPVLDLLEIAVKVHRHFKDSVLSGLGLGSSVPTVAAPTLSMGSLRGAVPAVAAISSGTMSGLAANDAAVAILAKIAESNDGIYRLVQRARGGLTLGTA